ncbi:AAA family ATPase [Roseateles sp. BYS78W]|uniref:AAA family ATPase n=1 Tax=Pelomonas candidula TaxID=3299025 RepID=A0ABW7HDS1_9BURK
MTTDALFDDPYDGNPLVTGLGPLISPVTALAQLTSIPRRPNEIASMPKHVRLHHLMRLIDLHIPAAEEGRLRQTIDLMLRQGYRHRDPRDARSWRPISGEWLPTGAQLTPASAAVVVGHSGVGKSQSIRRSLLSYPSQLIVHNSFPQMVGEHTQVVWQSIDVPPGGRSVDLGAALMIAWDHSTGAARFKDSLKRPRRDGSQMLDEWRHVALSHFLGILHLDEVQNFFKLAALKKRSKRGGDADAPELSIVEDLCLKWLLVLINTWQIPVLISGTPDGVGALTRRFANAQRFSTMGYHRFERFESAGDKGFRLGILKELVEHQYVQQKLPMSDELASLVIELTAGIPRIIIALWIAAHRVAFSRKDDALTLDDLRRAAEKYLAPVKQAVAALNSDLPHRMARYEDLVPREDAFWGLFWTSMASD